MILVCVILQPADAVAGRQAAVQEDGKDRSADLTRYLAGDAALVLRSESVTRFRQDLETFVSTINPLASMMFFGITAELQNDPIYLAIDHHRPVALTSIEPGRYARGGLALVLPVDDDKLFAEGFAAKKFTDTTLVMHEGWAIITSDAKLTPQRLFRSEPTLPVESGSTMTGSVRVDAIMDVLRAMMAEVGRELGEAGSGRAVDAAGLLGRAASVLAAVGREVSDLGFRIDLGKSGAFVAGSLTPVADSALASFLAVQKPSVGACRGIGNDSDLLRLFGNVDWRPLIGRMQPFLIDFARQRGGMETERAELFANQIVTLAGELSGELAMSLGFDHASGFHATQAFAVRSGKDARVGQLIRDFADDPSWLTLAYTAAEGTRFVASGAPSIDDVPTTDYRFVDEPVDDAGATSDGSLRSLMPGAMVAVPGKHLMITFGSSREDRMKRELASLPAIATGAAGPVESVPDGANLALSVSLIDYFLVAMSLIGDGPIPKSSIEKIAFSGTGRIGAYVELRPEKLAAGLAIPMRAAKETVDFAQQQIMARMMEASMQSRGKRGETASAGPAAGAPEAFIGKPLPNLTLSDLAGKEHDLASLRGKVVLLDFCETWCPPCIKEVPGFIALHRKYGDSGLVILSISDEPEGDVRAFVDEHELPYPMLRSRGNLDAPFGKVISRPTTMIIDREGVLVAVHVGFQPVETFEAEIRELLR